MGELISNTGEALETNQQLKIELQQLQKQIQIRSDWLEEREENFNIQKKQKKTKATKGRELTDDKKMGQTRTNREESKTAETKEAKHVCATEKRKKITTSLRKASKMKKMSG